MEEITIVYGLL